MISKLVDEVNWRFMSTKGQGHTLTLVQVSQIQYFQTFSSITAKPIEAKFDVGPPWDGGMEVCPNGPGHITKIR